MPTQKNQGQNGSLFFKPMVNTMSTIQNTTREKYNFAALMIHHWIMSLLKCLFFFNLLQSAILNVHVAMLLYE